MSHLKKKKNPRVQGRVFVFADKGSRKKVDNINAWLKPYEMRASEIKIDNRKYLRELMIKRSGVKDPQLPQVFFNDEYVGGFSEFRSQVSEEEFKIRIIKCKESQCGDLYDAYRNQQQIFRVSPNRLYFPNPTLHSITSCLKLVNLTDKFGLYKMKTTDPRKYRVKPKSGVVRPHGTVEVRVHLAKCEDFTIRDKFQLESVATSQSCAKELVDSIFKEVRKTYKNVITCNFGKPPRHIKIIQEKGENIRVEEDQSRRKETGSPISPSSPMVIRTGDLGENKEIERSPIPVDDIPVISVSEADSPEPRSPTENEFEKIRREVEKKDEVERLKKEEEKKKLEAEEKKRKEEEEKEKEEKERLRIEAEEKETEGKRIEEEKKIVEEIGKKEEEEEKKKNGEVADKDSKELASDLLSMLKTYPDTEVLPIDNDDFQPSLFVENEEDNGFMSMMEIEPKPKESVIAFSGGDEFEKVENKASSEGDFDSKLDELIFMEEETEKLNETRSDKEEIQIIAVDTVSDHVEVDTEELFENLKVSTEIEEGEVEEKDEESKGMEIVEEEASEKMEKMKKEYENQIEELKKQIEKLEGGKSSIEKLMNDQTTTVQKHEKLKKKMMIFESEIESMKGEIENKNKEISGLKEKFRRYREKKEREAKNRKGRGISPSLIDGIENSADDEKYSVKVLFIVGVVFFFVGYFLS